MHTLLNDPETIPFVQGNQVCLGMLKKDINRRVKKIRSMLEGTKVLKLDQPSLNNQESQTE